MGTIKFRGIGPVKVYVDATRLCECWCDEVHINKEVAELINDGIITTRFTNFKMAYYSEMGRELIIEN